MIEGPAAPVNVHMAMEAIRHSMQQERNVASVAIPLEKAAMDFEGKGPADPARGSVVDISV